MQLAALIQFVWHAVLGLWTGKEVAEDDQMTPLPTPTSTVVVHPTSTEPSYTMAPFLSFSSAFSILSMFVLTIIYLSKLPAQLLVDVSLSYYKGLSQRQYEELKWLRDRHMDNMWAKEDLEIAVAQHLEDLKSAMERHEVQLQTERQKHEAEIGKRMVEHARDLQQLRQTQEKATEQQAAILASSLKTHVAEIERLKTEHSRDLQLLQLTHEKANERQTAIAARASKDRSMVESSLRQALGDAHKACKTVKAKYSKLQISTDREIERLEKKLEVLRRRQYDAERKLAEQKFIGEDEWNKLRAEKQEAVMRAHGASKERDIFHNDLREICAKSAEQSKEVAALALTATTATQKMNDTQLQLAQKDKELAETLKRNEVLRALVRKVQAALDERDQAPSKAEEEGTRAKQVGIEEDGKTFNRHISVLQELHDARAKNEQLTEKLRSSEAHATKATEDLNKARGERKSLNEELIVSKLQTLTTKTEVERTKSYLGEAQKNSFEAQNNLKTARNKLSELKGADARAFLATDVASKAQKDLMEARAELKSTQAGLSALKSELGNIRAELLEVKAERMERETAFQKFQEIGKGLELEVNNLQQMNAELLNTNAELGHTKGELANIEAELGNTRAELSDLKEQQMGRETSLQKCQKDGQRLELEANNLRQTNTDLGQEIISLKINLNATQAEATPMLQNQQHGAVIHTGQVDPASMPATVENQDSYNSEDDAMEEDEYHLLEDAWPGISRPEATSTATEDQKTEKKGEIVAPLSHEEAFSHIVPDVSSDTRQLDDIDLDLLGENDSHEPEKSGLPATSSAFTIPQFSFMAPLNVVWPPSNIKHTSEEFEEAHPEEQPARDKEDTARLIEEELEKDLENSGWSEPISAAPQSGPELIYGDYLQATQQVPQQTLSGLMYGAKPQAHAQEGPQSTSPLVPLGQTCIAITPKLKIPGLFHDASTEATSAPLQTPATSEQEHASFGNSMGEQDPDMWTPSFLNGVSAAQNSSTSEPQTTATRLQLEAKHQQFATSATNSVQPGTPFASSQSPLTDRIGPVFDPTLMSLNEWALPQEQQIQSSMASFVPEPSVPTSVTCTSPFTAKSRSREPVGAFTRAMYNIKTTPCHSPPTAKSRFEKPVGAFSQAMYEISKTPSHTLVEDFSAPSFLASLIKPTVQTPTVTQVHSQALRPNSQYSTTMDPDLRSKRFINHSDTSDSRVPRFSLGVMGLPGASSQVGYSQISPHYAVQTAPTTQHHAGPATPEPVRRGFASLPTGNQPYIPDVATLSALLGHQAPAAATPVAGSTSGNSIRILHPPNLHVETKEEVKRKEEIEGVLRGEVVIDLGDSSESDEDETEEERKVRKMAQLVPAGQRKIVKLRKRKPAA
ncbi:Golgin A4 [Xylographa soralifera]|nr:Golgin A4 [Xylographa soralifera]